MPLTEQQQEFVSRTHSAAMITAGRDGIPKAVRVGIAVVDGAIWSSGTRDRLRTRRLRVDPRCTLFVFDPAYAALTIETVVTILDGPDVPGESLRMFRQMQGKPTGPLSWFGRTLDDAEFLQLMREDQRVLYQFEPLRAYGIV